MMKNLRPSRLVVRLQITLRLVLEYAIVTDYVICRMTVAGLAVMIHLTLDGHLLCMCSHENPNLSLGGIGIHDSSDLNIFWAS